MENLQNTTPTPQPVTPQQTWQSLPKPLFPIKKKDAFFAIFAVLLAVFTAVFGFFEGISLGYSLSVVLLMVLFTAYFAGGGKVRIYPVLCGLLALFNSCVFVCTSNGRVRFCGAIIVALLSFIFYDGLTGGMAKGNRNTLSVFYGAVSTIDKIGVSIKSLFSGGNGSKKILSKVLIGLACALPVLVVVVPLLISSDDAFRGMLDSIFSSTKTAALKVLFGLMVAPFLIAYGLATKKKRIARLKTHYRKEIDNVYIISFLGAICACYLLYLFSQLAYFFSAFKGFLPDEEFTYAQYARKGFFEMCVIAVINLAVVFAVMLTAKKQEGRICITVKILTTFIAVFTLIIVSTAISKMVLYIGVYGMTVLRICTSAFMVFVSIVFIAVSLRIYVSRINIVKVALLTAGCITLILGSVNVNALCARYNYEGYQSGKLSTVDVDAMHSLGDEGIPYLVKLASGPRGTISNKAKQYLAEAYLYDYFENMQDLESFTLEELQDNRKNTSFASFSIPNAAAYESLYSYLTENPEFAGQCQDLIK